MTLELLQGEAILFRLTSFAYFFDSHLPTWRMPMNFPHAQGSLWLTNKRFIFQGGYQTRKPFQFGMSRAHYYNHFEKDASFEIPTAEILDMQLCKIGGVWPTGIEVSFASGRTIIFSLFGRKQLYDAFHKRYKFLPPMDNQAAAYSFEQIKELLQQSIKNGYEAELTLHLKGREYMIIIYDDHCSFQRCGSKDGSGEQWFSSLDELYGSEQIDDILLKRDWAKISSFECCEFDIQNIW